MRPFERKWRGGETEQEVGRFDVTAQTRENTKRMKTGGWTSRWKRRWEQMKGGDTKEETSLPLRLPAG